MEDIIMKSKILKAVGLVVLFQLTFSSSAQAAIFKCVNQQDEVFYHDKPCPVNHKEKSLKHVKDPKNAAAAAAALSAQNDAKPTFKSNGQAEGATTGSVNRNASKSAGSSVASGSQLKEGMGAEVASLAGKGTIDAATGRVSYKADELPAGVDKDSVETMSEAEIDRLSPLKTF